jgi:8-oxo-dGTP pyrophosphatase MutT (NUDIX family)
LETTALRETWEEIGVKPEHVKIIGQLDDMVTISNFRVTPYVGLLDNSENDYPFCINDHEVAQVVQVPLSFLLDETNMELEVREHQGREVLVPAFSYNGHRIWGATARMLHQFIELLR